jgi:hypothetical protein
LEYQAVVVAGVKALPPMVAETALELPPLLLFLQPVVTVKARAETIKVREKNRVGRIVRFF